jgi:hypothetical protein
MAAASRTGNVGNVGIEPLLCRLLFGFVLFMVKMAAPLGRPFPVENIGFEPMTPSLQS